MKVIIKEIENSCPLEVDAFNEDGIRVARALWRGAKSRVWNIDFKPDSPLDVRLAIVTAYYEYELEKKEVADNG